MGPIGRVVADPVVSRARIAMPLEAFRASKPRIGEQAPRRPLGISLNFTDHACLRLIIFNQLFQCMVGVVLSQMDMWSCNQSRAGVPARAELKIFGLCGTLNRVFPVDLHDILPNRLRVAVMALHEKGRAIETN
jgi:hypothetical protein